MTGVSWLADVAPALTVTAAIVGGTLFGFVAGLVPGVGGRVGLVLAIPVAVVLQPATAAVFLFAMHAVVHTSGSIPSIAYGLPTSASDAATVQDGYPMARAGKAGLALGASLTGSVLGGVIGAVAFLAAIPAARPLITLFGPPEMLLLMLIGLAMVVVLSRQGLLQGLVGGALGMLLATCGLEPFTGTPRYTFGFLELWDGLSIAAIVGGLFVVPEAVERAAAPRPGDTDVPGETAGLPALLRGMREALRHWRVMATSSGYGFLIGLTPGIGSSVACWLSYAHTARTVASEVPYGQGAIAGVIAPETANNAKEGGAMVPTLFFGIPGSSSMAIMLGAFALIGIRPGGDMVAADSSLAYLLGTTVILANLLTVPLFLAAAPHLVRFSSFNRYAMMPIAVAASLTAALATQGSWLTVAQFGFAALIGLGFKRANWPRAPILLGFVIGPLIEISLGKTLAIWGFGVFERWPFLALLAIACVVLWCSLSRIAWWPHGSDRRTSVQLAAALALGFAAAGYAASSFAGASSILPALVAAAGLSISLAILVLARRSPAVAPEVFDGRRIFAVAAGLVLAPLFGVIPAGAAMVLLSSRAPPRTRPRFALIAIGLLALMQFGVIHLTRGFWAHPVFAGYLVHLIAGS